MNDKFRYIRVIFFKNGREIEFDNYNFNIEFDLEMTRNNNSNILELNIYNLIRHKGFTKELTDEFMFFADKPRIELHAGYVDKYGKIPTVENIIFTGILTKVIPSISGLDVSYNFLCMQEIDIWTKQILNVDFPAKKKPSEIVMEIVEKFGKWNDIELKIGKLDMWKDIPYSSRFSKSNATMEKIFEDIAKDTYTNFYIDNSLLYFIPKVSYFDINSNIKFSELIGISQDENGMQITTGFKNLRVNTLIDVEGIEKKFVIDKIAHSCDGEKGAFTTTLALVDLEILGQNINKEAEKIKQEAEKSIENKTKNKGA